MPFGQVEVKKGEYKEGRFEGRGVCRYANGNVYDGEWKAGLAEGRGVYRSPNGDGYNGEWKAGQKEGRGVMRYAEGDVYDGEWKADKREGRGVFRYANGDVYDGEWKADRREGRGVYRYANGDVDAVFLKQSLDVGEGVKWMADGRRAVRMRDGKVVEEISLEEARQTADRLGLPTPSSLRAAKPSLFSWVSHKLFPRHAPAAESSGCKQVRAKIGRAEAGLLLRARPRKRAVEGVRGEQLSSQTRKRLKRRGATCGDEGDGRATAGSSGRPESSDPSGRDLAADTVLLPDG